MPRIPEHPKAAQRSRGPTGKNAKPPAEGPPPEDAAEGPREVVKQASRDIKAGIPDDERGDRGHVPDDVPGPRDADPRPAQGARVKRRGAGRHE